MRLVDVEPLFERAVELEAVALEQVRKYEPSEKPIEWNRWSGILGERTAFKYDLMDAPTIDAEPIRHGRWELSPFDGYWTCNKCGNKYPYHGNMKNMNYCPNCGAKMDEVKI